MKSGVPAKAACRVAGQGTVRRGTAGQAEVGRKMWTGPGCRRSSKMFAGLTSPQVRTRRVWTW